jgi:hypothetical protein
MMGTPRAQDYYRVIHSPDVSRNANLLAIYLRCRLCCNWTAFDLREPMVHHEQRAVKMGWRTTEPALCPYCDPPPRWWRDPWVLGHEAPMPSAEVDYRRFYGETAAEERDREIRALIDKIVREEGAKAFFAFRAALYRDGLDKRREVVRRRRERREELTQARARARWRHARENLGRPLDLDGERRRGVWLTYRPSGDPRLDNFEPVDAAR